MDSQTPRLASELFSQKSAPLEQVPPLFKCYCTALEQRSRYRRIGSRDIPCDGTLCASRRQEKEAKQR